ncbi:hypothetical protein ACWCXH_24150 [Kitasatospora sp. NPDC001660]
MIPGRQRSGRPDHWADTLRGTTQMLVVPHGYTLCISGVLATTIAHRGLPTSMAVWMFVVGASVGFVACALLGVLLRRAPATVRLQEAVLCNLVPVGVVPAAAGLAGLVHRPVWSFLVAGAAASVLYVIGLALLVRWVVPRAGVPG